MTRARGGFTFIELITVLLVLAILAGIAILRYIDLTREAYTSQIAGDLTTVRTAVLGFYGDNDAWPQTSDLGVPPEGIGRYLPGGGIFDRPKWKMAWINEGQDGNGQYPFLGILVVPNDPEMGAKMRQRFGNKYPFIVNGDAITFVMSTPGSGY